jgi:putative membrane protein
MYNRSFSGFGGCYGYDLFYSGWNLLILLGFVLVLITVIALFLSYRKRGGSDETTMELLKMKFVKGEITEDEFLKKKAFLKGDK